MLESDHWVAGLVKQQARAGSNPACGVGPLLKATAIKFGSNCPWVTQARPR